MRLVENPVPQSYHLLDNDWTPLSQNPRWIWSIIHRFRDYMTKNRLRSNCIRMRTHFNCRRINHLSSFGSDTSFEDDLVRSGYCKCWEWALSHDPLRFIPCSPMFLQPDFSIGASSNIAMYLAYFPEIRLVLFYQTCLILSDLSDFRKFPTLPGNQTSIRLVWFP